MIDGRINFRKLEIFCLVVELGSVSEAARHLYMAQSGVSAHLRVLERCLGYRLITRSGRGFELTDEGQRFYDWSLETLDRARELDRELHGLAEGSHGSVSVGASMSVGTYILPEMIAELALARPQARVALVPSAAQSAIDGAISGQLDFSVVGTRPQLSSAKVVAIPLVVEPYVLVAAADVPDLPDRVGIADVSSLPFVCVADERLRNDLFDEPLQRIGAGPRKIVLELGHTEAMKRAVERGLGFAFMLRPAVEREISDGRLKEIPTEVELSIPISLVHRANRTFSPLQRDLMEIIRRGFRARDATLQELTPASATTKR